MASTSGAVRSARAASPYCELGLGDVVPALGPATFQDLTVDAIQRLVHC